MLSAKNISFSLNAKAIVQDINFDFHPGKFYALLGPNGSGKTTLLKLLCGFFVPQSGAVFYNNLSINNLSKKALAKSRAVLSQYHHLAFPLSVSEVIMMGRYPYFELSPGEADKRVCNDVIKQLNLEPFADRNYETLSGGGKTACSVCPGARSNRLFQNNHVITYFIFRRAIKQS